MKDRFDMEEDLYQVQCILDELDLLIVKLLDGFPGRPNLSEDDLANILMGLTSLYKVKFEKLWDTFCQIHELDYYGVSRDWLYKKLEDGEYK